MGGLGPGIGGLEYVVIGLVALLVLGPERLPVMMRRVGQWVGKARRMADEFRSSFDEMARQSELDDLRKEVDALRRGQSMYPLGPDAAAAFKDINASLTDQSPVQAALAAPSDLATQAAVADTDYEAAKPVAVKTSRKPKAASAPGAKTRTAKPAKPRVARKTAVDL